VIISNEYQYMENLFNNHSQNHQTEIDFTTVIHNRENNSVSQEFLDKNRTHFTGQAAIILTELKKGSPVYAEWIRVVYNISANSFVRRIADLGDCKSLIGSIKYKGDVKSFISEYGVDIDREWMIDKKKKVIRQMMYFLPENRQKFINRGLIIDRPRWWYSENYSPRAIIDKIKKAAGQSGNENGNINRANV
jgi:hypothetical protein